MTTSACPRCATSLAPGAGALGEDVCPGCQGRVLGPELTRRVLVDELGLDPATVKELASHFGGKRLPCARCGSRMSPVTVRAVAIDVCLGCGAVFLDDGELARLSGGLHREVAAPPAVPAPAATTTTATTTTNASAPAIRDPDFTNFSYYPVMHKGPAPSDDSPVDARKTWEKALPMYLMEIAALYAVLEVKGVRFGDGAPLERYAAAAALVGIPMLLSMLVDVDWRGFRPGGRRSFLGERARGGGIVGIALIFVGVVVSGAFSTVNAMIHERWPKIVNGKTGAIAALVAGGIALFRTIF